LSNTDKEVVGLILALELVSLTIKFSLSIAEQGAVGFILAWSLAFLQKADSNDM